MSCERHTVSKCHSCDCTSPIIIQVPGLQGTGILWENCTEAEKQEITQMLYDPIKEQTDKSVQIATESAAAAKASEEKTAEYAEAAIIIKPYVEDISKVAEHVDDCIHPVSLELDNIHNTSGYLEEIHIVGQDLISVASDDLDCGWIGEELNSTTQVVGGNIKKVAEHIDDCVHPVATNLDTIIKALGYLEPIDTVAQLMSVDYKKLFEDGY